MDISTPKGRFLKIVYPLCLFMLVLTGFGQMPVYARYGIASLPGLAWSADFYFTHALHQGFAAFFLALLVFRAATWFALERRGRRLTGAGAARAALFAGLAATGTVKVLKNMSGAAFSPDLVLAADLGHVGFTMALLATLGILAALKKPWLRKV
jgi:hypothetical protein